MTAGDDGRAPTGSAAPSGRDAARAHDAGGSPTARLVATLALLAFGTWALVDTTGYSDIDSVVFPRTVGIALVTLCLIALVQTWLRPAPASAEDAAAPGKAAAWRPVLLVLSMLLAVALMGTIGFLPAALLAFAASLVAATHGRWSAGTLARHALAGLAIVLGFFALFSAGLNVPLP